MPTHVAQRLALTLILLLCATRAGAAEESQRLSPEEFLHHYLSAVRAGNSQRVAQLARLSGLAIPALQPINPDLLRRLIRLPDIPAAYVAIPKTSTSHHSASAHRIQSLNRVKRSLRGRIFVPAATTMYRPVISAMPPSAAWAVAMA